MRISDWSSDVCSSDLPASWARARERREAPAPTGARRAAPQPDRAHRASGALYAQQITLAAFGRLAAQFDHRAFLGLVEHRFEQAAEMTPHREPRAARVAIAPRRDHVGMFGLARGAFLPSYPRTIGKGAGGGRV